MGGVRAPDLQQIWLVWGVSGRVGLGCEGRLGAPCKGRGNTKSSKFPMPPMPPTTITRWRVGVGGGPNLAGLVVSKHRKGGARRCFKNGGAARAMAAEVG